jgi:type II secretory pathway pseudopilin PulG
MNLRAQNSGLTLIEIMVTTGLVGILGLIVFSILNIGTVLGAKNAAVNTAHQQARTAMLQMTQDLHSSVSLPALADANGSPIPSPSPGLKAPGIAFQLYAVGPLKIAADAAAGQQVVTVIVPAGTQAPVATQRLIVRTHGIEDAITAVAGAPGGTMSLTLANNLPVPITITNNDITVNGGANLNIACFITDRCSYAVVNGTLDWRGPTVRATFAVLGSGITNQTPFQTPTTPAGSPYFRFVAAIDLSTSDQKYSNRGYKAANILLNGMVPMRARLTDSQ